VQLEKGDLVQGLKKLGVEPGMVLCVHCSLSAFGKVVGGASGVIEALMVVVGKQGTLMMPTHPARDGQTFNPEKTPSAMGVISEVFRNMPGVIRSRHPYHPVAAWGKWAEKLLADHEKSPVPDGMETPYGRLAELDGFVLLMGCDLDTMTLLHHVEAELNLPYLRKLDMTYMDEDGIQQVLPMINVPGGHRGGVLKFDALFKNIGIMRTGHIGRAVCRLILAPDAVKLMQRFLSDDPSFVLDDNLFCEDCLRFRGLVNAERLKKELYRLHIRLPYHTSMDLNRFMMFTQSIGATGVEVDYKQDFSQSEIEELNNSAKTYQLATPILRVGPISSSNWTTILDAAQALNANTIHCTMPSRMKMSQAELMRTLKTKIEKAANRGIRLLVGNQHNSMLDQPSRMARYLDSDEFEISFNPLEALRSGIKPFYEGVYSGRLRRRTKHIDICDGVAEKPINYSLGQGKCEIREILSNLNSRMFTGTYCLWPIPLLDSMGVLEAGRQFWQLMDMI
jgi:aminoglycoside 3-N-acetyltransferase